MVMHLAHKAPEHFTEKIQAFGKANRALPKILQGSNEIDRGLPMTKPSPCPMWF